MTRKHAPIGEGAQTRASKAHVLRLKSLRLAAADFFYSMDPSITAELLGFEPVEAGRLRQTRNYKERIMELQTQLNRKLENVIQEESEKLRAGLASMVPRALEVLNTSLSDSEGQIALRAAQEILDRDGRMPKVSRIQTSIETENPLGDVDADTVNEFKDKGFKEYVQ